MSRKIALLLAAPWIILFSAGCSSAAIPGTSGDCPTLTDPDAGVAGPSTDPPKHTTDVAACAGGASQADIDKNVHLAADIESALSETNGCGAVAHGFSVLISEYFARIACGKITTPGSGLVYAGSGLYTSGTVMQVQARLAKDTSFGKAGDELPFDVFDSGSYWGSVTISANLSADLTWDSTGKFGQHIKGSYEITIEDPKPPGLELWGIVPDNKPIKKEQQELAAAIADHVVFEVNIKPMPVNGVSFWLTSSPLSIGDPYNGKTLPLSLTSVEMTDPMATQTVSSMSWDISYNPAYEGLMQGSTVIAVKGGLFPYFVKLDYPNRATPDVTVSCNAPSP